MPTKQNVNLFLQSSKKEAFFPSNSFTYNYTIFKAREDKQSLAVLHVITQLKDFVAISVSFIRARVYKNQLISTC